MPSKVRVARDYMGHTYTKQFFVVYLNSNLTGYPVVLWGLFVFANSGNPAKVPLHHVCGIENLESGFIIEHSLENKDFLYSYVEKT